MVAISPKFKLLVDITTVVTFGINFFVWFYPDLLNNEGQCNWKDETYESNYPILDEYLSTTTKNFLVNGLPFLRKEQEPPKDDSIHMFLFGDPQINGNWPSTKYIKRLDNYGNDYYLGHIYQTMKNRLRPSHVVVMGDLFSSQWIYDSEFYNRTLRYVTRLFPQPDRYIENVLSTHSKHEDYDWKTWLKQEKEMNPIDRFNSRVYNDVYDWTDLNRSTPNFDNPLFINLTGNHDIGYSGDATWQHMARFHLLFGQNNYVINYKKGKENAWRIVVLDSLTLEGPALQEEFLNYTWSFLSYIKSNENPNFKGSTILLTHIPLYKEAGLCTDGPEHKYYINNEREPYKNGKLRSQNHLNSTTTKQILDIIFPNKDKNGIILTGHDHEGCDNWYNLENDNEWKASKERNEINRKSIREIVVRSMMGDFDGQTGILTGNFKNGWDFDFSYCSFTVQHWWWASKISILITVLLQSIVQLTPLFSIF
ncbi:unnamed protein product [Candida verbasci]|uniref:Calcineurin-like phosphoesterase domain-containing protein n=1 Tax=Candida verbasci TaxID=1227364 RepID=A0A9W4TY66_9ASCO|nr:unnamed protein product [Candida verbasci]